MLFCSANATAFDSLVQSPLKSMENLPWTQWALGLDPMYGKTLLSKLDIRTAASPKLALLVRHIYKPVWRVEKSIGELPLCPFRVNTYAKAMALGESGKGFTASLPPSHNCTFHATWLAKIYTHATQYMNYTVSFGKRALINGHSEITLNRVKRNA